MDGTSTPSPVLCDVWDGCPVPLHSDALPARRRRCAGRLVRRGILHGPAHDAASRRPLCCPRPLSILLGDRPLALSSDRSIVSSDYSPRPPTTRPVYRLFHPSSDLSIVSSDHSSRLSTLPPVLRPRNGQFRPLVPSIDSSTRAPTTQSSVPTTRPVYRLFHPSSDLSIVSSDYFTPSSDCSSRRRTTAFLGLKYNVRRCPFSMS
jgi:hypothetical protein